MSVEKLIFSNLLYNEEYARKVIPFLKEEYFHDFNEKTVFGLMHAYIQKYNNFPTKDALIIELTNKPLGEQVFKSAKEIVESIEQPETKSSNLEWLLDQTEKFCQEKAIYNGIMQSIQILDDKSDESSKGKGSIPKILSDALGVSFDTSVGHDFLEDADSRFEFYHTKEVRIPFDLDYLNKITNGGLPRKTLNIALAGTGVGKSLFMCHCAAANMMAGFNVLYITMEMAEERIGERIDANLLDISLDDLKVMPKDVYDKKIARLKGKGKLIVKEYPTACAGSANFRHLLNELKIKKNFIPDIIYIDYLNICMSSRIKHGANVNSYTLIKAIAEELRGLAVEHNVPIVSATQTTRSGYSNSDVGLEDTSESFGLPATADFMFALITSEQLHQLGQIMVKQLKNRYNDPGSNTRFVVGVDRSKMRLYNVEQSAQDLIDDKPVMDNTTFGTEDNYRNVTKIDKSKFKGFK